MHVDADTGHALDNRAGGAGVIEMDMRQQHRANIAQREAAIAQSALEHGQARRRARIDQRDAVGALQDRGRDHARAASEMEIDVVVRHSVICA